VQEVFAVSLEQLGLADFVVRLNFTVRLDGDPYPAAAEPDRDANPVAGDLGVPPLDSDEVFSDGERVLPFRLDAPVEPLRLLAVRGVEFNIQVARKNRWSPSYSWSRIWRLALVNPTTFALTTFCTCITTTSSLFAIFG
jgi:hypothetical protein